MNNSVFGKAMGNITNRVDVRLVTNEKQTIKLTAKPNYDSRTVFDEKLIATHMKRTKLLWRACCYFIILSVIFPDGNRSLLAFLSDLLAR